MRRSWGALGLHSPASEGLASVVVRHHARSAVGKAGALQIRPIRGDCELGEVRRLVHDVYLESGLIKPQPDGADGRERLGHVKLNLHVESTTAPRRFPWRRMRLSRRRAVERHEIRRHQVGVSPPQRDTGSQVQRVEGELNAGESCVQGSVEDVAWVHSVGRG